MHNLTRRKLTDAATPLLANVLAADWSVAIVGAFGQSIDFGTGNDAGATMRVELYDVCRVDSPNRYYLGELYPGNSVFGLAADHSAIVNSPGSGNKISYGFTESLNQTTMYYDNGNGWATVKFCAQIALYDGSALVNLGEIWVEYSMDLYTQEVFLQTYTITDAAGYTDASDASLAFDGNLRSYFCDPNSFAELINDGFVMDQGSLLSVCFQVYDGQFEMKDVMYLTVKSAWGSYPSQDIIIDSYAVSETVALKSCVDNDHSDANICVVQFILNSDFYETSSIELTGLGMVLLELGDSARNRWLGGVSNSATGDDSTGSSSFVDVPATNQMEVLSERYLTKPFQVKKIRVSVQVKDTTASDILVIVAITVASGLAGLLVLCWCYTSRISVVEEAETVVVRDKPTNAIQPSHQGSHTEQMDDTSFLSRPIDFDQLGCNADRQSKAVADQGANQVEATEIIDV
jgi:hypothetical protein